MVGRLLQPWPPSPTPRRRRQRAAASPPPPSYPTSSLRRPHPSNSLPGRRAAPRRRRRRWRPYGPGSASARPPNRSGMPPEAISRSCTRLDWCKDGFFFGVSDGARNLFDDMSGKIWFFFSRWLVFVCRRWMGRGWCIWTMLRPLRSLALCWRCYRTTTPPIIRTCIVVFIPWGSLSNLVFLSFLTL